MSISMRASLFAFLFLCATKRVHTSVELKLALFTSSEGFDSSGAVPAIELAEEMVNSDSSILPGYTLKHDGVRDTRCNRARSLELFFEDLSPPNSSYLGLIGCGCSVASTPVAEIVQYKSLSQVAYGSASVELDNGDQYPHFFRTHPSDAEFEPAFLSFVEMFGWKRIGFLTQDEGLFTGILDGLTGPLAKMNVTVRSRLFTSPVATQSPAGDMPITELTNTGNFFFEDDDYRVFFINAYSNSARQIICEAQRRGYTYANSYAWIIFGWYVDEWWTQEQNPSIINCTNRDLEEFLHRAVTILVFAVSSDENAMTDTGLTEREFNSLYSAKFDSSNYTFSYVGTLAYDALWTLAFALNRTNRMLIEMDQDDILNVTGCVRGDGEKGLVPLEMFTNDNELMGCVIRWNLQRTDFIGVSGRVRFNDAGSRFQGHNQIFQYRWNKRSSTFRRDYIALTDYINNKTVIVFVNNESTITVYPDSEGGIPPDGRQNTVVDIFHLALVGIYYALTTLGLIFSTVCLIFNLTQRNEKVVRLTSPNLNYFLIAGTYLMFLSVFFRLLPSSSYDANFARCILEATVDTIGYCLVFGVLLAKMGRIYYIFSNPTASKHAVKDWQLILVTLIITGIGALLVIIQVSVPRFRPDLELRVNPLDSHTIDEDGIRIRHFFYACYPEESQATTWIIVTFLYLALLQVIGIILAVQTRKVKVKVLNDSKYIAALIYISSIVLVTRAVAVFALHRLFDAREAVFSGGIILIGFASLSLVFIPNMVNFFKDPKGEKVMKSKNGDTSFSARMSKVDMDKQSSKIEQLEARVAELETTLELKEQKTVTLESATHQDSSFEFAAV